MTNLKICNKSSSTRNGLKGKIIRSKIHRHLFMLVFLSIHIFQGYYKLYISPLYRYPSQKSAKIQLRQGSFYFMEALMKEGGGGDHLSVAMKRPGGYGPTPISKNYLFVKLPGIL